MKPIVWHLIGDKRAGGSNRLVKQLISSSLEKQFDFAVLRLEEAKAQLKHSSPDVIIFHYPCAWKYLTDLWLLKQHSQLYIYDHHYSQGFEQHQVTSKMFEKSHYKSPLNPPTLKYFQSFSPQNWGAGEAKIYKNLATIIFLISFRFRFRLMLRLAYGLADEVVSISNAQRDWMLNHKLVKPSKIRTIYSASPVDTLLTIPAKDPIIPLKIGAYGRFAPQKGFDLLLTAFASLPGEKFQLYLGGYGQDEQLIKDLARDLPHVKLLGAIEDVPSFLADCDVIVIPSRWEPWGLVCLEAKAAGKPVVAFAVDGLREQVRLEDKEMGEMGRWRDREDGETVRDRFQIGDCGLLVPANDIQQLAAAIKSLPQQNLIAWGEAGRTSVVKAWTEFLHSWELFLGEITA